MSKIFKDLIPNKKTDTKQVLDLAKYSLEKQEKVTFTQDEIFNKKVALKKILCSKPRRSKRLKKK